MVSVASHAHRVATSLLLQTSRALDRDYFDEADIAACLHEAFTQYARSYLAQRTLFGGEDGAEDAVVAEWFDLAPRALSSKGAAVLRKLNYLTYASPYRPLEDGEEEWDAESLRDEFTAIVGEIAALLGAEARSRALPPFRGEEDVCLEPGAVVRYALYDWGEWTYATCTVVSSRPPTLLLRFPDRHYEEVDVTIANVRRVPGQRVDLDDPFEAQRTRFELALLSDDVGLYDDPHFPPTLGIGRAVITCACCGYPTRRMRFPAFLRLAPPSVTHERCVLCGWADVGGVGDGGLAGASPAVPHAAKPITEPVPEPLPEAVEPVSEALRHARARVRAGHTSFAPDDASEVAEEYREPSRLAQVARASVLFEGFLAADTFRARAEVWSAAQVILRSLEVSPTIRKSMERGSQRVSSAVEQAYMSL